MFQTFPDWILPSAISAAIAFLAGWLTFILRNRRVLLTYHVTHERIGISALDKIHGNVAVTVDGNPVQNLFMSNIRLVNRSMHDVENIEVKVFCGPKDMQLMSEDTHVEGTVEFLKHTAEFEAIKHDLDNAMVGIQNAKNLGDNEEVLRLQKTVAPRWSTWKTNRWYAVPVMSRGQKIRFTYMTSVLSNTKPIILISCQKAGVRLKYKEPYQPVTHLWGVSLSDAALAGIVISVAAAMLVIYSISIPWLAAFICLVLGFICQIFGAGAVKLYRCIRDQLIG